MYRQGKWIIVLAMAALGCLGPAGGLAGAPDGDTPPKQASEAKPDHTAPARGAKPTVKNGLSLAVTPVKRVFSLDEPLVFKVTWKNLSDRSFMLFGADGFDDDAGPWRMIITDVGTDEVREARRGDAVKREQADSTELAAGKSLEIDITLGKECHFARLDAKGEPPPSANRRLPPGRYEFKIEATFSENKSRRKGRGPHWTGSIVSQPVEFAVVQRPSGKAVNGLRLTLSLSKGSFRLGEDVSGMVRLENVGNDPLLVLPAQMRPAIFAMFEVIGPDGNVIQYTGPQADWAPDYDKALVKLAPGSFVDKEVGFQTRRFTGYDLEEVGDYRITASYSWKHAKPPPTVYRGQWKHGPMWTGTVRSNTVTAKLTQ